MRFAITLAAIISCALSPATAEPETRLTWDIIQSDTPTYPFEDELNACILNDVRARGIGEACLNMDFGPDDPLLADDGSRVPELWELLRLNQYWLEYWNGRVSTAYRALVTGYAEDDEVFADSEALLPHLKHSQSSWMIWRDAKCHFEEIHERGRSQWASLDGSNCRLSLIQQRALELEHLQRVQPW